MSVFLFLDKMDGLLAVNDRILSTWKGDEKAHVEVVEPNDGNSLDKEEHLERPNLPERN